jgi:hypothetical protein
MNKLPSFRNEATSGPVRVVGPAVSPAYVAFEVLILSVYVAGGSPPRRSPETPPRASAPSSTDSTGAISPAGLPSAACGGTEAAAARLARPGI